MKAMVQIDGAVTNEGDVRDIICPPEALALVRDAQTAEWHVAVHGTYVGMVQDGVVDDIVREAIDAAQLDSNLQIRTAPSGNRVSAGEPETQAVEMVIECDGREVHRKTYWYNESAKCYIEK